MKKTAKHITIKQIKMALSNAYSAYMMKKTFLKISTLQVDNVKRIDWSGCDLQSQPLRFAS